uniref:RNA helicase n=1 Tax=Panagrellus redivivus TaxID=6233 RepID=A0A7E4ZWL9_PANRE
MILTLPQIWTLLPVLRDALEQGQAILGSRDYVSELSWLSVVVFAVVALFWTCLATDYKTVVNFLAGACGRFLFLMGLLNHGSDLTHGKIDIWWIATIIVSAFSGVIFDDIQDIDNHAFIHKTCISVSIGILTIRLYFYMTRDTDSTLNNKFEDFHLKRELREGIMDKSWERPTPIQKAVIGVALSGQDILARAKNGSGKTGAYCIPLIERLDTKRDCIQALIIVPTRKVAHQTAQICAKLGNHLGLKVMVTTGDTDLSNDSLRLNNDVHLVVATPGRLSTLITTKGQTFNTIKSIVLDGADALFAQGNYDSYDNDFQGLWDKLKSLLPSKRQIMLFSATFPRTVAAFVNTHMHSPYEINLMDELTLLGVTQFYAYVQEKQKIDFLKKLLLKLRINQSIIFCNKIERVELLAKKITEPDHTCFFIHSDMTQQDRNRVFSDFREGHCRHLVCSDELTRGIDIQAVNMVINFDFPPTSWTYFYRVGRAAQFGRNAVAINLVTYDDRLALPNIEKELQTRILSLPSENEPKLYNARSEGPTRSA